MYCQEDHSFLIFNLDMKVYWRVSPEMQRFFDDADNFDSSFFFIPDSGTDGVISKLDNAAQLIHSGLEEHLSLTERAGATQELKVHDAPYQRRDD